MTGRLRLKVPSKKGDGEYLKKITEEFSSLPGIAQVIVNTETSSVLFLHNLSESAIMGHLSASGLFRLSEAPAGQEGVHRGVKGCFREMSGKVEKATGGTMGISEVAFLALFGAGVMQIGRGNFTAIPWYTAFWYALNIFLKSDAQKAGE
jgi:hypothetical protein